MVSIRIRGSRARHTKLVIFDGYKTLSLWAGPHLTEPLLKKCSAEGGGQRWTGPRYIIRLLLRNDLRLDNGTSHISNSMEFYFH
jgi:hypothetical protein